MKSYKKLFTLLYFLFTAIIISAPALINGYPIMHFDSSNYITQSVNNVATGTNPIGYPLFVRAFSWQFTLWPVVFAQGLLLSILIFFAIKNIIKTGNHIKIHIFIVVFLSFFSAMSWISSKIMADVFTPISIISLYLFLSTKTNLGTKIFSLICIGFSSIVHFTNPAILISAIVLLIIIEGLIFKSSIAKYSKIGGFLLALFIVLMIFNKNYNSIFKDKDNPTNISHILIMARLAESGILSKFLDENCQENRYALCNYKDEIPGVASEFVWRKNGVFSKTGSWKYSENEYKEIENKIFTNPYYLGLFIYKGILSTFKQLFTFKINNIVLTKESPVNSIIHRKFKYEEQKFKVSLQHYPEKFNIDSINFLYYLFTFFALSYIIILINTKEFINDKDMRLFIIIIVGSIFINSAITGTFSNVVNRYQARVNWLLIMVALIFMIKKFHLLLMLIKKKINLPK